MTTKEKLSFVVKLSGTFWEKAPLFSILIDGKLMLQDFAGSASPLSFAFEIELEEHKEHTLEIRLENKRTSDTVLDGNKIIKDLLLNIHSVKINRYELGETLWTLSKFVPDDPNGRPMKGCRNLGSNGSYTIKFTCPFEEWTWENLDA